MTPEQFCYWLQGFFEIGGAGGGECDVSELDHSQVLMIKNHLNLVFTKVTSESPLKLPTNPGPGFDWLVRPGLVTYC